MLPYDITRPQELMGLVYLMPENAGLHVQWCRNNQVLVRYKNQIIADNDTYLHQSDLAVSC